MERTAILFGLFFVGILLLVGAAKQVWTGQTTGSTAGRKEGAYSVVRLDEMPLLFGFLLIVRVVLGVTSVLASVLLSRQ